MKLPWGLFRTDVGRQRTNNEDNGWSHVFDTPHPSGVLALAVVADGVGGHASGEVASQIAVDAVKHVFLADPETYGTDIAALIRTTVTLANTGIQEWARANSVANPATTIVLCAVAESAMYMGSVGDSRGYVVTPHAAEQITEDDSFIAAAVRKGELTAEEAESSPLRNRLERALGLVTEPTVEVKVFTRFWEPQELILLCSDGLYEYVKSADMVQIWRNYPDLNELAQVLIGMANDRGGSDNISVSLLRHPNFRAAVVPNSSARGPSTIDTTIQLHEAVTIGQSRVPEAASGEKKAVRPMHLLGYGAAIIAVGILLAVQSYFITKRLVRPVPTAAARQEAPQTARLTVESNASSITISVPAGYKINPPKEDGEGPPRPSAVTFKLSNAGTEYKAGVLDATAQASVNGGLRVVVGKAESLDSFPLKQLKERNLQALLSQRIRITTAADINADSLLVAFSVTANEVKPKASQP